MVNMGLEPTTSDGLGLCSTTELNYPTSAAFRIAVYALPIFRDSAPGRTHEPHPLQYVLQRILFDLRFRVDRILMNIANNGWYNGTQTHNIEIKSLLLFLLSYTLIGVIVGIKPRLSRSQRDVLSLHQDHHKQS